MPIGPFLHELVRRNQERLHEFLHSPYLRSLAHWLIPSGLKIKFLLQLFFETGLTGSLLRGFSNWSINAKSQCLPNLWKFGKKTICKTVKFYLQNRWDRFSKYFNFFFKSHCFANVIFSGFCWIKISGIFQFFPSFFGNSHMIIFCNLIVYLFGFANVKN